MFGYISQEDAGRWPPAIYSQMLRSPQDTHVDHLRSLIDQRSTRADIHGGFSAISEYSDTPSVYSRPCFSPKSSDNDQVRNDHPSPTSARSYNHTPSMLDDLDDDSRSSFAPSEKFNIDDTSYDDNSTARMSYLGPKMRFHSRAPWELEDDTLEEEAEQEEGHRPFHSVFPFRGNSASSSSSSPRPSYATSRPSGESSRSQIPPKRSFETTNSQISYPRGALYLAQESVSSCSLGRSTPPAQKEILRSKFSLGRLRTESSNFELSPSSGRSPLNGRFPPSPRDNDPFAASIEPPARTSRTARKKSVQMEGSVHPYANPDLVVSCIDDRPPHFPFRATSSQQHTHDEVSITPSESCITDSISRSGMRSTVIPDTTANSALPRYRISSIQVRNISSPVSVIGTPHRIETPLADNRLEQNPTPVSPGFNILPGWTDTNVAPAFSLISLEEARAQRVRSATATPTSRPSNASEMSNYSAAFPPIESDAVPGVDPSHVIGSTTRARSHSISAGASKARSALQTIVGQKPERRDSEPAIIVPQSNGASQGKSLKHKKSGFMRLFNAGRVPEKDERTTSPPVPSLPDSHSFNHVQPVVQQTSKSSTHRIPIPIPSPSLLESSSPQSSGTLNDTWKQNTKRTLPSLSINIQPSDISPASVMDNHQNRPQEPSPFIDHHCQIDQPLCSAPAEFPALKLRPVSTLFSAHFGDHIVANESESSSKIDSILSVNDQASVLRSLQEQLVTSKKAWQLHIWELEGQVRDLKATVEELKGSDTKDYCESCGRGKKEITVAAPHSGSVVHRPRARTGTSSRFTNALP